MFGEGEYTSEVPNEWQEWAEWNEWAEWAAWVEWERNAKGW
jgi:hypothetical protein